MEEVAKKEPEEMPTLRISDVQTVKTEDPEKNFLISVRTPTSINNGTRSPIPGRIMVKRLGSTTIRSVPSVNTMKQAAKAQLVKMANGNYQTHPAYTTSPPNYRPVVHAPLPKPVTTLYRAPPDPRDDIIRQLQEQNREMKKMLVECRREASQIQTKTRRWTVAINEVLGRVQRLQAPGIMKAVPQKPTMVPLLPPPMPPAPMLTALKSGPVMKVTARKSTSLPPPPPVAADVVFRSPAFPIKSFSSLKTFESDLKNRDFFDFVGQKLMGTISKFKIEKPATLLAYVLQTLVNPSLLSNMVWDNGEIIPPPETPQRLALANFWRLRELYSRLVNNMSKNLYGKNLDPAAVERFLRSKVFSDLKFQQHNAMVQQQQLKQRQAAATMELRKSVLAEKKSPVESSSQEDDDVEWIDDGVGESCELGNEILGDDSEEKDDEHENEAEGHEGDGDKHPETTVEENAFHFMDC